MHCERKGMKTWRYFAAILSFFCIGCAVFSQNANNGISLTIIPFHRGNEDACPHILVQRLGDVGAQIVSSHEDIRYLPGFATVIVENNGRAPFQCSAFSGKEWKLVYEGDDGREETFPVWPLRHENNLDFKHPDIKLSPGEMDATTLSAPPYDHLLTIMGYTSGKVHVEYSVDNIKLVSNKIDVMFLFAKREKPAENASVDVNLKASSEARRESSTENTIVEIF